MNLSNFSETLSELLFDAKLNPPAFAKIINCGSNTITRYLQGKTLPTVKTAIRIAEYFNCSLNYLFGLTEYENGTAFKKCPPFKERLPELCKQLNITKYQLQKSTGIPESAIYNWQSGKTAPSIESVAKIAETYDRSMDFIIGREK